MKVDLIRQKFNNTTGYKFKPFSDCCNKIKNNPRIMLANEVDLDIENLDDFLLDDECSFPAFAVWHSETVHSWEDEWEDNYYYKINYCPFCGEPIEVSVVSEEDMDEYYQTLSKQRKELQKKYHKTDSKKKSEKIKTQVQELDSQIDWLYQLAEYKDVKKEQSEEMVFLQDKEGESTAEIFPQ